MAARADARATRRTVLVALAANASIAVGKLVAGVVSGSSAMLAETSHSVAETMNQVFLLYSLRMSEREPDAEHPFGYGKERFFWSFLAAVGIFVAGAGFSLYEGLERVFGPTKESGPYGIAYAVLAFSLLAEGTSLARAVRRATTVWHRSRSGCSSRSSPSPWGATRGGCSSARRRRPRSARRSARWSSRTRRLKASWSC
jgi:cation diffusion facilitator family transporter